MPPEPFAATTALATALTLYPTILTEDLLRYVIGATAVHLAVNLTLATGRARRIRRGSRPDAAQIRAEIADSLRTALIFSLVGLTTATGAAAGVLQVYMDLSERGWPWIAISTLLLIVLHDGWFYWAHRIMHHPRLFRRFHRTHHRSHNPTAFAAYRFDVSEALVQAAYLPVVALVLPVHPLAIFLFTTHMILRNAIGHSGVELFPARSDGRPLLPWLTTVTHHDLHHQDGRWNLGLYFTWWDRLCGTEHPDYAARFAAAVRRGAGVASLALALAVLPAVSRAETLTGTWATEGLGLVVRFAPCTGQTGAICGHIVHAWDPALPTGGLMVTAVHAGADGGWTGQLTDPRDGRSYRGTLRYLDADKLELRGCAGPVCTRRIWWSTRWLESVAAGWRAMP